MHKFDTLLELFKPDFRHLSAKTLAELEGTEEFSQLREKISEQLPKGDWDIIRAELLQQVEQLLDIDIQPILIESWKTHQDVEREISKQQDNPDHNESAIVPLDDHEIRSTHTPHLELTIGENLTGHLRIFIGIVFNLKNVALKIYQGEIVEIMTAEASGNGFMQYQNATLIEKDFLWFDLAGRIKSRWARQQGKPKTPTQAETGPTSADDKTVAQTVTTTSWIPTHEKPEDPRKTVKSNMIQFIVGISIALLAVLLFWQLK